MNKQGEMGWIRVTGLIIAIGLGLVLYIIGVNLDKITKKGVFANMKIR